MNAETDWKLSPLRVNRIITILAQLKPVLRPSARRDLSSYISNISDEETFLSFMKWADGTLNSCFDEKLFLKKPRTRYLIQFTGPQIFRRPIKAYRSRLIFRPRF